MIIFSRQLLAWKLTSSNPQFMIDLSRHLLAWRFNFTKTTLYDRLQPTIWFSADTFWPEESTQRISKKLNPTMPISNWLVTYKWKLSNLILFNCIQIPSPHFLNRFFFLKIPILHYPLLHQFESYAFPIVFDSDQWQILLNLDVYLQMNETLVDHNELTT